MVALWDETLDTVTNETVATPKRTLFSGKQTCSGVKVHSESLPVSVVSGTHMIFPRSWDMGQSPGPALVCLPCEPFLAPLSSFCRHPLRPRGQGCVRQWRCGVWQLGQGTGFCWTHREAEFRSGSSHLLGGHRGSDRSCVLLRHSL